MEKNQINFLDENGKPIPLEEVQKAVEELYTEMTDNCDCCEESVLEMLTSPEGQIDPEKSVDTLNFLERSLYLCDEIKPGSSISFADAIRFWNTVDDIDEVPVEERKPIKIYIDCPGGDINATFSIIDSIRMSKTPVWTITIGRGYSGAFFIGSAGHKRYGYPHSSYLFHEGCAQDGGDAHKFLQGVKFYEKQLSMLRKITLKQTRLTEDDYKKHRKDDLWMTAEEALKYGVIDEIIEELV